MAKFNHLDIRGTKKVPSAFGNVFICSGAIGDAKTVTFPDGYLNGAVPEPNLAFKAVFPAGHNAANASSYLSLNGIVVVSNQNGALLPLPVHEITSGTYSVLQANVVLDLYYTENYDGNSHPAFVVVGNPVVLSSASYTIYADGSKAMVGYELWNAIYPVGSILWTNNSNNPGTYFIGTTWEQIKDRFLYAAGTKSVDTTGGAESVTLGVNQIPSHDHTQQGTCTGGTYRDTNRPYPQGEHDHGDLITVTWDATQGGGVQTRPLVAGNNAMLYAVHDTSNAGVMFRSYSINGTGTHDHSVSVNLSGKTSLTGGGLSHENMPPYVVKYCWERTK